LINELADSEDEIYLFLDDYHWITHPEIHDAFSFLLQHAPISRRCALTWTKRVAFSSTKISARWIPRS
jgi:LuxR family maltose regulon positive regulatory protein